LCQEFQNSIPSIKHGIFRILGPHHEIGTFASLGISVPCKCSLPFGPLS
jgi:hypothetical protein